ncbi:MAG: HEAT repeat domain-containing protein [Elusimicrobiota bacterium]
MFFKKCLSFIFILNVTASVYPQSPTETLNKLETALQSIKNSKGIEIGYISNYIRELGEESLPILKRHAFSSNLEARRAVYSSLNTLRPSCEAVQDIIPQALSDNDFDIKNSATVFVAYRRCDSYLSQLRQMGIQETNPWLLRNIITALGEMGSSSDVSFLNALQNNAQQSNDIRLAAAGALMSLGQDTYDKQLILNTLNDPDWQKALQACYVLRVAKDDSFKTVLENAAQRGGDLADEASISLAAMNYNQKSSFEKTNYLFQQLETGAFPVKNWATFQLLNKHDSSDVVNRLKQMAKSPNNTAAYVITSRLIEFKKMKPEEVDVSLYGGH